MRDKIQEWKEYEEELISKENDRSGKLSADKNYGSCQNVTKNDVMEVLCGMKTGKTGSPSKVTADFLKQCEEKRIKK